ncbi:expressed conserved protein [Echinococcus multilocularis]|uniref:Expressed conserved protein n=1 Tax=Echinococcus multilocularis TaxID=6211 RepID=A0A068XUG2_ECHMU|nr:expressed conserved protein [Echinococcus multilocularis]
MSSYLNGDPRRPGKIHRYTPPSTDSGGNPTIEFVSFLGMVLSIGSVMFESKWCAWIAIFCALGTFGNARASDDVKHLVTMALLAVCVLVMSYFHNPAPLTIQI